MELNKSGSPQHD